MTLPAFVEEYRRDADKAKLGPGPWQDEPDKCVWVDEATGLDCMVNRGPVGAWCGYVGVPEGHPWHGKGYDECLDHGEPESRIDVHGGLNFASACSPRDDPAEGICHIEQPGRPEHVWWFGFDCAHAFDLAPRTLAYYYERAAVDGDEEGMRIWSPDPSETYRDLGYVVTEVRSLARQLAAVAS